MSLRHTIMNEDRKAGSFTRDWYMEQVNYLRYKVYFIRGETT